MRTYVPVRLRGGREQCDCQAILALARTSSLDRRMLLQFKPPTASSLRAARYTHAEVERRETSARARFMQQRERYTQRFVEGAGDAGGERAREQESNNRDRRRDRHAERRRQDKSLAATIQTRRPRLAVGRLGSSHSRSQADVLECGERAGESESAHP